MIKDMTKATRFIAITFLLAFVTFFCQKNLFLSGDVAVLLHETGLFLKGGKYVTHFFETNPPMIFYLYAPVYALNQFLFINMISAVQIYIILIALVSVAFCCMLIKKIIKKEDYFIANVFLYTLLFVFLFLPIGEFGQREHIFLILMMPYLLAAVCFVQNKKINVFYACLIGVMAGLGVGLKPYFLMPFILVEIYLMIKKRSLWSWLRIESIVCASLLAIYLTSVFLFQENYIKIMMPIISRLYFSSIHEPWSIIFSKLTVVFCLFVAGYYFFYNKNKYSELTAILMWALVGMILAFMIPRAAWFYHVIPAFGVACLLASFYISMPLLPYVHNKLLTKRDICICIVSGLLVFCIPLWHIYLSFENHFAYNQKSSLVQLVKYIHTSPYKSSVYCFSANTTGDCFPLVYLIQSYFAGRSPFFWWLPGILIAEKNHLAVPDKDFLIESVADDLNSFQPAMIVINKENEKMILKEGFNFIDYLSKNRKFLTAWKHYVYLTQIGHYQIFRRV